MRLAILSGWALVLAAIYALAAAVPEPPGMLAIGALVFVGCWFGGAFVLRLLTPRSR